ncbi:MAG: tetratricopeptide (TPR) repeat protein [Flavobacteriaceae bacterium]|jgi:tetratricopeptide (TPR) repeat protein
MTKKPDTEGTLEIAVRNTERLLEVDPKLAVEQANEILNAVPNYPPAQLLLISGQRHRGNYLLALDLIESLLPEQPRWAAAHFEYALLLGVLGRGNDAIAALRTTVALKPQHPEAWRVLADHLMAIGESDGGDEAYARHIRSSVGDAQLQQAASAMIDNDIPKAERLLKAQLKKTPTDVPAIRMLAEVAVRCGNNDDAEKLLVRCLALAPSFTAARYNYATLLHRLNKSSQALVEIERLLLESPSNPSYRNLTAVILSRVGDYERSSLIYSQLLEEYPANAKIWLSYGHVLKTEGRQEDCIAAYRQSIQHNPSFGEAYWSLANLKTFRFSMEDMSAMKRQVRGSDITQDDRVQFEFALGKAAEDAHDYALSFQHYNQGNSLYRESTRYDADGNSARIERLKCKFTSEFLKDRIGSGHETAAPIFIVGMPRSGSTLLEQILASHSLVEGTTELPDIISMALEMSGEGETKEITQYNNVLATKSREELRELGAQYIERTRVHRKTDSPFFIDKMPNNFLHIGMIHLILPNAKIIDARRHPLGCCFSNFKQYYARGQNFSYSLSDIGRFYHDYVELMGHFDEVLPGRVHRVIYEDTVEDTEAQVRKLLAYCQLDFEPDCLRFFENQRGVRTASSEQVRQPIYRQGMEQWINYEPWLNPLKESLGPVLDAYPDIP